MRDVKPKLKWISGFYVFLNVEIVTVLAFLKACQNLANKVRLQLQFYYIG